MLAYTWAGKSYTWPVWGTLFMMLGSAIVGATTDVRFTWHGYGWQLANCLFTSAYALYLRSVMDKVSARREGELYAGLLV
jgi:GDP-mannose transporter